jgi:hypothetical protein
MASLNLDQVGRWKWNVSDIARLEGDRLMNWCIGDEGRRYEDKAREELS